MRLTIPLLKYKIKNCCLCKISAFFCVRSLHFSNMTVFVLLLSVTCPFPPFLDLTHSTSQGHRALRTPLLAVPSWMWPAAKRGGLPRPQVPAPALAPVSQLPNPALFQTGSEPSRSGPAQLRH